MMNRSFWWVAACLIVSLGFNPVNAQDGENLLDNGGFETGDMTSWGTYGGVTTEVVDQLVGAAVPDGPIEGSYALRLEIAAAGTNFWDAGLQHTGHVFEQGKHYTLSAFFKMESGEVNINFKPELGQDPWTAYGEQQFTLTEEWTEYSVTGPVIGADVNPATITFHVQFAPAVYWIDGVRFYEGDYVPPAFEKRVRATDPSPAASVLDVPRDAELGWVAGVFANTHDVYFGTNFADVNAASADTPLGVLASQGQSGSNFQPADTLDFGQTYYWRVDEVNAAPDQTVYPGPVWAFTTEPFSDPITPIAVTASSSHSAEMDPEGIIDGSGLDAAGQHNILATDMWLSAATDPAPLVQFEFDKAYRLHEMWVWNSNQGIETVIGFGSQDVTVELSMDGENWTALDGVPPFTQAPGVANYTHNTTVDFGQAVARYVQLSITSGWGPLGQVGLSEVRFFYIPTYAREPQPADGSTTDRMDVTLRWRGGRGATSHQVVMSSDRALVEDHSAVAASVADNEYAPAGLTYGETLYWRINEIDEASASTFEGDVWSFTVPRWLSVDDFEMYRDEEFFEIWSIWVDGFGDEANNGAIVGNGNEAERVVVQEGRQSLPLQYDNTSAPVSSATRTFDTPQDWTQGSPEIFSARFRGNADNGASPIYLVVADSSGKEAVVTHPDAAATVTTNWTAWETALADLGGIDLSSVSSVTFGVGVPGGSQASGAAGTLFIDNLRIGTPLPKFDLFAHYALDGDTLDSSGNGFHGTAFGNPAYIDRKVGMGLEFDGVPGSQYVDLGDANPSNATGELSVSLFAKWNGLSGQWQGLIGKRDNWAAGDMMWHIEANRDTGELSFSRESGSTVGSGGAVLPEGEWQHVGVTFDSSTGTFYVAGDAVGSAPFSFGTGTGAALVFGCDNANGGNPFNGALDEIFIYDRALSAEEMAVHGKLE